MECGDRGRGERERWFAWGSWCGHAAIVRARVYLSPPHFGCTDLTTRLLDVARWWSLGIPLVTPSFSQMIFCQSQNLLRRIADLIPMTSGLRKNGFCSMLITWEVFFFFFFFFPCLSKMCAINSSLHRIKIKIKSYASERWQHVMNVGRVVFCCCCFLPTRNEPSNVAYTQQFVHEPWT